MEKNNNNDVKQLQQTPSTMVVDPETLKEVPLLSTMTALRHIITKPGLEFVVEQIAGDDETQSNYYASGIDGSSRGGIGQLTALNKPQRKRVTLDKEYFDCVNKADKELLQTGIRLRSEIQRTQCSKPTTTASASASTSTVGSSSQVVSDAVSTNSVSDPSLLWFCDTNEKDGTLAKFEKISLDLFLRNLDSDERDDDDAVASSTRNNKKSVLTLVDLEKRRQIDLQKEIKIQHRN